MPQKGFAHILILIGILILILIIGGVYYFSRSSNKSTDTISVASTPFNKPQPTTISDTTSGDKYELSGTEVLKIANGQQSVLFKNVTNVTEVRLGPDEKTLHFKVDNFDSHKSQELCANLESKIESVPADYKNPPPNTPPWDYQKIANAYTINHCNTYYAGGYLKNSGYFVYLVLTDASHGKLYYQDLGTGELNQLQIKSELLIGFNDGYNAVNGKSGQINSYWVDGIVGKDGYQYYYPQQDSNIQDKTLILAFGRLILAVDTKKNGLIGGTTQQGVVATSFHFLSQKSLPFIVVESAWEGPPIFNEIIDVTNNNFKIISLAELDKRSFFRFKVEPIIWGTDSVLFNFTDFEDATKKLPSGYDFNNLPINDDAKMAQTNSQAEQLLKNNFGYQEVKCSLGPGMVVGCDGLKKINHYKYTPIQGLVQI